MIDENVWGCLGDLFAIVKVICMLCMDVWLIVLRNLCEIRKKDLREMIEPCSDYFCDFDLLI